MPAFHVQVEEIVTYSGLVLAADEDEARDIAEQHVTDGEGAVSFDAVTDRVFHVEPHQGPAC